MKHMNPKMEVEKLSATQEYKKQLLTQKSKLKELFDSVLHKSMKGERGKKTARGVFGKI